MWLIWLAFTIVLLIVESLTVAVVSVWFAIGSVAAMIASLFTSDVIVQTVVFVVVSLATLAFTRPLVTKYIKINSTNVLEIIGKEGVALSDIVNDNGGGQAKIGGQVWTAKSMDNLPIKKGARIVIKEVKGVSVIVERVK